MRLTSKMDWQYDESITIDRIKLIQKKEAWVGVIGQYINKNINLEYLELGCAPGQYSAALCQGTEWRVSGIDYSEDADRFVDTLALVGKRATLYQFDLFEDRIDKTFDIVASYGLVEHFREFSFDQILKIHDAYTKKDGYVVIEMPNLNGLPYWWRYVFDKTSLDLHNVDVMRPSALSFFSGGYDILYCDYVGVLRLWINGASSRPWLMRKLISAAIRAINAMAIALSGVGVSLRGQTWSPVLLMIARKK